jgi:hypothetical protein
MGAVMLNPDARSLYTGAVTPPPGYLFDQAVATTYSLDPATVLSLPTHIALAERPSSATLDPIMLLESLRRLSGRFSVYVDHAGIKPPSGSNILFGLLESMVIPTKAPRGGVFHPKMWVLRFVQPDIDEPPLIRLLLLSRNITYDRSWDISLQLEGRPGRRYIAANRPLGEFLSSLPTLSTQPVEEARKVQIDRLADELRKTVWELPEEFEEVVFHIIGSKRKVWSPSWSRRMAVISPFITDDALSWLSDQTEELVAVVSRPEELNQISAETLQLVGKCFTLDEAAETEDGEEPGKQDTVGLHAKVYVAEKGWWTRLYLGSANATSAALLQCNNSEVLVELVGRTSRVGGIETLLGKNGLGHMLAEYSQPDELAPGDDEEACARKALEKARDFLAHAELKLTCERDGDAWRLSLVSTEPLSLSGISAFKAWPITVSEDRATDIFGLIQSGFAEIGRYAPESVTGLVAFEFVSKIRKLSLRMVLNIPVEGLPENRDDVIFKLILNNREGFLRYLFLLLGEYTGGFLNKKGFFNTGNGSGSWAEGFWHEVPILEELARAFSRSPDKLKDVQAVVNRLMRDEESKSIVPKEFIELWDVFEIAMEEADK